MAKTGHGLTQARTGARAHQQRGLWDWDEAGHQTGAAHDGTQAGGDDRITHGVRNQFNSPEKWDKGQHCSMPALKKNGGNAPDAY